MAKEYVRYFRAGDRPMRSLVFLVMGLLELAVAGVLVAFGWQLPAQADVDRTFGRAEHVTRRTGTQVRLFRQQVHDLRRPELQDLGRQLQAETKTVTGTLRSQAVDFDRLRTVGDALGDVAEGLDGLSDALDGGNLGKIGEALGTTASYLDEKVAPSAGQAAKHLDESTAGLAADAKALGALLRQAPPDLKAARDIHDSLGRFSEGLDRMQDLFKAQRLTAMRDGFKGLDTSLTTGAEQVDRLAGYHYPVVTFRGLKPEVEQRKFWPEGDKIADGMRKAAAGAKAADEEMAALENDLPKLRTSLEEGRKMADRTREALAVALKQQDKVEALLKNVPEHSARLAEELPKLSGDLARILRETERLKDVAAMLRQAQKGVDAAVARWPQLKTDLGKASTLLRATRGQVRQALDRREEYEAALKQSIVLAESFATLLPIYLESLDRQMQEQEQGLDDLGRGLDEVTDVMPEYARATNGLVGTARLLAWLVAAIVAVHGAYLLVSVRLGHLLATGPTSAPRGYHGALTPARSPEPS
jgi:ABC-type transporter Mla subunit MlaD